MFIKEAGARTIKDSRGEWTIEVSIKTLKGKFISSSPEGKSKGKYESPAYHKLGVAWSVKLLNDFLSKIEKQSLYIERFWDMEEFEKEIIDFEKETGYLGANSRYALETAVLKAAAAEKGIGLWKFILGNREIEKFPMPIGNCIEGGMHVKDRIKPDFQEFLLIPHEKSFTKALSKNIKARDYAKKLLKKAEKKLFMKTGDEGGWKTGFTNEQALDILKETADKFDLSIGIDVAASTFFNGEYIYKNKRISRTKEEQIEFMAILGERFDLLYIEDPLEEEDFRGFSELSKETPGVMVVGDDLTATHFDRIKRALVNRSINALIVKPNQNGSIVEVAKIIEYCKKQNIKIIFSHRSGETMDDALADYALGFQADFIKAGIFGRERLIKLKRIMDIEKNLGFE
jgi:enolase